MDPASVEAQAAALRVPFSARREHDLFAHCGGPRVNAESFGTRREPGNPGQRDPRHRARALPAPIRPRYRHHVHGGGRQGPTPLARL